MLLYLLKEQSKLPETLTEMNKCFILHTIYRSLRKSGLYSSSDINTAVYSLENLPRHVNRIVVQLSELAFVGIKSNQLVFSYSKVKDYCPEIDTSGHGLGLLQVVQHYAPTGPGETATCNFLHYTMQEFLATFYVTQSLPEQQESLIKETFWQTSYSHMWMMCVGISEDTSQIFINYLGENTSKLNLRKGYIPDKLRRLHLFQCLAEAKNSSA